MITCDRQVPSYQSQVNWAKLLMEVEQYQVEEALCIHIVSSFTRPLNLTAVVLCKVGRVEGLVSINSVADGAGN